MDNTRAVLIWKRCKTIREQISRERYGKESITIHPADKAVFRDATDKIDNAAREIAVVLSHEFPWLEEADKFGNI